MKSAIRRLDKSDAMIFRQLRLQAFKDHPDAFGSSFDEFAARPIKNIEEWLTQSVAFGAFFGETLVAIGAYFREEGEKMKHRGYVVSMYTSPDARGQGLAREIIEQMAEMAIADGIVQLHLSVTATNEAAKKSYQRSGFETYGVEPRSLFVDGQYLDEELMVRFLDKAPKGQME